MGYKLSVLALFLDDLLVQDAVLIKNWMNTLQTAR